MQITNQLKQALQAILKTQFNYEINTKDIMLELPKDKNHGDFATNIAMRLTKVLRKNPREIATTLINQLDTQALHLQNVEIAGPGFINFTFEPTFFAQVLFDIFAAKENYGKSDIGQQQKILVEYISANPTGKIHIGHARGAAWGDSMTRLLKAVGYDVLREYYINDAGNQIDNLVLSLDARIKELLNLPFELPSDGYHGSDVIEIAEKILAQIPDINNFDDKTRYATLRKIGVELELNRIKDDLNYFRCPMDSWISEQMLYDTNKVQNTLEQLNKLDLLYEKEGATWFKSSQFGDDKDRVIIKQDGSYTYLLPDTANHLYKIERGYHHLINLWGADHHGYIPRMQAMLQAFNYPNALEVDIVQVVRLISQGKEVKMSKRTGNAITLREFCDDIGVDAVRYFMVMRSVDTHFDFDMDLAQSQSNDNPVFYVQYAHARICSILKKAADTKPIEQFTHLIDEKEIQLLKTLASFSEVIQDAALTRLPNKICNYVQTLAQQFHSFYTVCPILNQPDTDLQNERLWLIKGVAQVLKNALALIGVEAIESM